MAAAFDIFTMTALTAEFLLGVLANAFLATVTSLDWLKSRSLSSSDTILLTLGVSNVIFQGAMLGNDYCAFFWLEVYRTGYVGLVFYFVLKMFIFVSFWLTAWLCVVFCVKIVTFSHPFVLWIKLSIDKSVPWLLLVSLGGSFVLILPSPFLTNKVISRNGTAGNLTTNDTVSAAQHPAYLPTIITIGCCLPLLMVVTSTGLIVSSLCRHARRIERSTSEFSSPHVEAHVGAIRVMASLLFLYVVFYMSEVFLLSGIFPRSSRWFGVCLIGVYSYAPAEAIVLTLGNPKLKRAFKAVFCRSKRAGTE